MARRSRIRWLLYLMLISWLGGGISAEAFDQLPYHALPQQQAYPVPTATPPAPAAPPAATSDPFFSTPTPRADGKIIYIVQAGDTLVGIATRFGYSVEQLDNLYALNGLTKDDFLFVGQELLLGRDQGAVVPLAGNVPPRYAGATYREADNAFVHTVQAGDTLISIALKYGYQTMDAFYAISGLQVDSLIAVGQAVIVGFKPIPTVTGGSSEFPLTIPPPPPTAAPPTPAPTATRLP
ncbi:MAG TPA: LysM domain-containing protein, partial [Anaerolineae bacterium]|nr:LysM domain-containing protein [Anaerolineae bacterium]